MQSLRVSNRNITLVMVYLTLATILFASGWFNAMAVHAQSEIVYNFENGEVGDWVVEGQVDIVSSYIDPQTANAMQTVAQGNFSVRIGDEVPWGMTGDQVSFIEREIIVPAVDAPVLQFSYAVVANDPSNHAEVEKPNFRLEVVDLTTNETLPVSDFKYSSQTSNDWYLGSAPDAMGFSQTSFFAVSGDRWVFIPWRHEKVDLTERTGHRMRISFILSDCSPSAHAAYGYFDNIRIGNEVDPPPLPALVGDQPPQLAGAPVDPGALATFLTWVEQNKIWPLLLCLTPLLLLLFMGLGGYGVVQATRPKGTSTSNEQTRSARKAENMGATTTIREPNQPESSSEEGGAVINPQKQRGSKRRDHK